MKHPDYDYDEIADNIFFPIYDRIAEQIIDATDVRNGKMLDIGCGERASWFCCYGKDRA